jgi:GDPmannose 4,6-dehydratase
MPHQNLFLVHGDVTDAFSIQRIVEQCKPDLFFHLAAMSHVGKSFEIPKVTESVNCGGTLNCLEAIRSIKPDFKFYFAASSEMFGDYLNRPVSMRATMKLNEYSTLSARSPYGASKIYGFNLTRQYRDSYNIHACNGILFNHESPLRGEHFVTRKITLGIADIVNKRVDHIMLGNLDARRDWGFAGDYVHGMCDIIMHDTPDDFVIAAGESFSVKEFLTLAFGVAGLGDYKKYVEISDKYKRPSDIENLVGDASKARKALGWESQMSFEDMVTFMVLHDLETDPLKRRLLLQDSLIKE